VWLALAISFSTVIRTPATSALAALSVWLILTFFWGMIAPLLASLQPVDPFDPVSIVNQYELQQSIARFSPQTLYSEITGLLLNPSARSVGPLFMHQLQGAVIGAPLPTMESVMIVWPQISCMVAAMLVLFTLAYVVFQRQEVRA
jgi:ABC-2 type transport system permease protein